MNDIFRRLMVLMLFFVVLAVSNDTQYVSDPGLTTAEIVDVTESPPIIPAFDYTPFSGELETTPLPDMAAETIPTTATILFKAESFEYNEITANTYQNIDKEAYRNPYRWNWGKSSYWYLC